MTFQEVEKFVASYEVGWPFKAWDVQLTVHPGRYSDYYRLSLSARVPDRDTGILRPVQSEREGLFLEHGGERLFEHIIKSALLAFVEHELYESILVDGKRKYDPHTPAATDRA